MKKNVQLNTKLEINIYIFAVMIVLIIGWKNKKSHLDIYDGKKIFL